MDSSIELAKGMAINPFDIETYTDARKYLKDIKGLQQLNEFCSVKKYLPLQSTLRYIILIYSKDSFLNKKPMRPLPERQDKAARLAGFERTKNEKYHSQVRFALFELNSEQIFDFVFNYLIYQKSHVWSEICALEYQLAENQRIRMTASDDMKDMDKKANLTRYNKEWYNTLKEYQVEFYGDHEEVRSAFDIHRSGLVTIELYAKER